MRKAKPKKRQVLPDPVFGDRQVTKFVNHLMYDGKKSLAYSIFYKALDIVKDKMSQEEKSALEMWRSSLVVSEEQPSKCRQRYVQSVGSLSP